MDTCSWTHPTKNRFLRRSLHSDKLAVFVVTVWSINASHWLYSSQVSSLPEFVWTLKQLKITGIAPNATIISLLDPYPSN